MPNLLQLLPNVENEELIYIQGLVKNMSDEQIRQFAIIYSSRRKDPQMIKTEDREVHPPTPDCAEVQFHRVFRGQRREVPQVFPDLLLREALEVAFAQAGQMLLDQPGIDIRTKCLQRFEPRFHLWAVKG